MSFAADTLALINQAFGSTENFLVEFDRIYKKSDRKDNTVEMTLDGRDFAFKMFDSFNVIAVKGNDIEGVWVKICKVYDH
jgi:hypothetical protein